MYRNIRSARDTELLQQDMDQLQIWEKDWLMNFNASKCQTIHFSRKRNSITKMYTIHGEYLDSVDNATYLGDKTQLHSSMGPTLQLYLQEIRVHQSIPAKESRRHPEADKDRML